MIRQGKKIILFEKDNELGEICSCYRHIQEELWRTKEPPLEITYIRKFREKFQMEFSEQEMQELREFMETGHEEWIRTLNERNMPI
jgi:hypothetical protein